MNKHSKDFYWDNAYKKETKQGYPVKNIFRNKTGRKYAVIERPKGTLFSTDYLVVSGYDTWDGTWQQGYHVFDTRDKAIKYAKKNAYRKMKK